MRWLNVEVEQACCVTHSRRLWFPPFAAGCADHDQRNRVRGPLACALLEHLFGVVVVDFRFVVQHFVVGILEQLGVAVAQ